MALSFGLVTTVASAQTDTSKAHSKHHEKTKTEEKTKTKSEVEKKDAKTSKTESKDKQESKSKTESKGAGTTGGGLDVQKDQSNRGTSIHYNSAKEVKNWCKVPENSWMGVDNTHYRLNANGELEKSTDGQNWRLSTSKRWQDDQGTYFRLNNKKLETSKDGSSWNAASEHSWKGADNVWYKYNDTEGSIYTSQQKAGLDNSGNIKDDERKDISKPGRGEDLNLEQKEQKDLSIPNNEIPEREIYLKDTTNLNNEQNLRGKDPDYDRGGLNMQDQSLRKHNMEIQDEKMDEIRTGDSVNGNKNRYNDRLSPK